MSKYVGQESIKNKILTILTNHSLKGTLPQQSPLSNWTKVGVTKFKNVTWILNPWARLRQSTVLLLCNKHPPMSRQDNYCVLQIAAASQDTWGTGQGAQGRTAHLCSGSGAAIGKTQVAGADSKSWGPGVVCRFFTPTSGFWVGMTWGLQTRGLSGVAIPWKSAFSLPLRAPHTKVPAREAEAAWPLGPRLRSHSVTSVVLCWSKQSYPLHSKFSSPPSIEFHPNSKGGDRDLSKNLQPCLESTTLYVAEEGKLRQGG